MKKVLSIFVIAIMLVCSVSNFVLAGALDPGTLGGSSSVNVSGIKNVGNSIIQVLQTVGSVAAVIVLIVLGIKYMLGSTEEKAEYKKTMIPYVIGAILIFGAVNVAGYVFDMANSIK